MPARREGETHRGRVLQGRRLVAARVVHDAPGRRVRHRRAGAARERAAHRRLQPGRLRDGRVPDRACPSRPSSSLPFPSLLLPFHPRFRVADAHILTDRAAGEPGRTVRRPAVVRAREGAETTLRWYWRAQGARERGQRRRCGEQAQRGPGGHEQGGAQARRPVRETAFEGGAYRLVSHVAIGKDVYDQAKRT